MAKNSVPVRRVCVLHFSFLFLLTLPSFATTFKSSASSKIKPVLMEAFINNGVGKMLRFSICLSAICISWVKTALCMYYTENETLDLSFWREDLQFGNTILVILLPISYCFECGQFNKNT